MGLICSLNRGNKMKTHKSKLFILLFSIISIILIFWIVQEKDRNKTISIFPQAYKEEGLPQFNHENYSSTIYCKDEMCGYIGSQYYEFFKEAEFKKTDEVNQKTLFDLYFFVNTEKELRQIDVQIFNKETVSINNQTYSIFNIKELENKYEDFIDSWSQDIKPINELIKDSSLLELEWKENCYTYSIQFKDDQFKSQIVNQINSIYYLEKKYPQNLDSFPKVIATFVKDLENGQNFLQLIETSEDLEFIYDFEIKDSNKMSVGQSLHNVVSPLINFDTRFQIAGIEAVFSSYEDKNLIIRNNPSTEYCIFPIYQDLTRQQRDDYDYSLLGNYQIINEGEVVDKLPFVENEHIYLWLINEMDDFIIYYNLYYYCLAE